MAQEVGATKDHAYQVVALLVRNGFLNSDRGPGGGVRLARAPAEIKLVDVLRITQPELGGNAQEPDPGAPAGHPLLDNIVAAASSFFVRLLDRFTVADLVASPDGPAIACLNCSLVTARPMHEGLMRPTAPGLEFADDSLERHSI